MENNGTQWKTMENNGKHGLVWSGKQWKTMENDGKQWKTMENKPDDQMTR